MSRHRQQPRSFVYVHNSVEKNKMEISEEISKNFGVAKYNQVIEQLRQPSVYVKMKTSVVFPKTN